MKDLGDGQRAKARALMPEVARIVKPHVAKIEPRSMVTAPGTVRNFKKGGAVKHDDVKQDKAMVKAMVKPAALKKADGGAARAHAKPGTSTGTQTEYKSGGKACMSHGGRAKKGK